MRVPVHHADGVARAYAQFLQPVRQTADAVAQHAVSEALLIAVDDLLVRRMQHGRMEEVLYEKRKLICGGRHIDESARHSLFPFFAGARDLAGSLENVCRFGAADVRLASANQEFLSAILRDRDDQRSEFRCAVSCERRGAWATGRRQRWMRSTSGFAGLARVQRAPDL